MRRPVATGPSADNGDPAFTVMGTPEPTFTLKKHDNLVVFGRLKEIDRFCAVQ